MSDLDVPKPRGIVRSYLFSFALWSSLSLLTAWQYRVFDRALNIHTSLLDMIRLAEARGFGFAVLTPPLFHIVRRNIGSRHAVRYLIAYCLGVGPFMVLYACIRWVVLPPWDPALQAFIPRSGHSPFELVQGGFADQITIYIAIVVAAHAYEYFEKFRKQEMERYEHQQALVASELQVLKMQLHPHFLFNTLHGISTLIDSDQKTAKAMVIKLSSLLRTALDRGNSDLIPLEKELKFVGDYFDLEKMRLGPRLTVSWSIDPDAQRVLVPQLILQPLAENAIRHGIACSRERGWIQIVSQRSNGRLEIQIRNSIAGKRSKGTGVGLRNTEARLKHLYADEASLVFAHDHQTASVRIVLPALGFQNEDLQRSNRSEEVKSGAEAMHMFAQSAKAMCGPAGEAES
jgi:two-component system LytT family sensor kinase